MTTPDTNLTFAQNIIRAHTPDALEGHTVVVLEKTGGAGEVFRHELRPGQTPPKRALNLTELFQRDAAGPAYIAFAVTDNSELRTSTTASVRTDDQKHSFSVTIQGGFRVVDARLLVARRNDDPLRQMNEEAAALVAQELARKEWSEIRQSFRSIEQDIVPRILPALRRFTANYGLLVETLALQCQLGDQDMRLIAQEAEADLVTERRKIELRQLISLRPLQATVKAQERQDRVFDAAAEATAAAIRNVPGSIHSVAELARSIETFKRYSGHGGDFTERAITENALAGQTMSGAGLLITDMLIETEKLACDLMQKRYVQSCVLHLIAELLREDREPQVVETYHQRIVALSGPSHPADQSEALERFTDVELLRGQLC